MESNSSGPIIRVRDIRTLPFIWIHRALFEVIRPSWRGVLAYNALVFYSAGQSGKCKDVGIKILADRVGTSEDTMKRGLDELEEKKAIQIKARHSKQKNGKRQQLPNEYVLLDLVRDTTPI